jgi:UMF1 family MFS transporter
MKLSRNLVGWMIYDFANSSFTTIIVTVVFSTYFTKVVVGNPELGAALWGRAISISMALVAFSAPIFGAVADFSRSKKKFLFINCYLTVIFTGLLFFVHKGDISKGMVFFIIANFAFNSANVFYDAFLPEITTHEEMGKVSGMGWSLGYVGGLLSLMIALPLVRVNVRYVFPAVAAFFGFFAFFTFLWLKEFRKPSQRSNYYKIALQRLTYTFKNIRSFRELLKFQIAYLIYNDGIITVIVFAAVFGASQFGMKQQEIIKYFILAQLTSIIGAYLFGLLTDKIGARKSLSISLLIWTAVVSWAFFCQTKTEYYYIGLLAGLAIGASQSNSRTLLALLTPRNKQAEFFGFYAVTGRISSIFGPLLYGEIARITGSQRWSILSLIVFFITGGILLQLVNEKAGKQHALQWQDDL